MAVKKIEMRQVDFGALAGQIGIQVDCSVAIPHQVIRLEFSLKGEGGGILRLTHGEATDLRNALTELLKLEPTEDVQP